MAVRSSGFEKAEREFDGAGFERPVIGDAMKGGKAADAIKSCHDIGMFI